MSTPNYTPTELRDMAQTALHARDCLDMRYVMLVMELSIRLGIEPDRVEQGIEVLAGLGEFDHEAEPA